MVSILPSARTPGELISADVGQALQGILPQAVSQGFQRGMGLNAIDQLQADLAASGGDINKMLPALAKAYTLNPNLERSGLGQTFMQQAKTGRAFPNAAGLPGGLGSTQPQGMSSPGQLPAATTFANEQEKPLQQSTFATPSPFNVMTAQDMDQEAQRYATAVQDPNAYNTRINQLQGLNDIATTQRQSLEDAALKAGVNPGDLPRFMVVNKGLDPRNPSEWAQQGIRNFKDVKNSDDALKRSFIPGADNALLGMDRQKALKRLEGPVKNNQARGLEQFDREYLAENYLTPTEIESLYHPITPRLDKAISQMPRGLFPAQKKKTWGDVSDVFTGKADLKGTPFVSYEEALEKAPQQLETMQHNLADFFLKNVDKDTSLSALTEKIWDTRDYDWRQFGPALNEARQKGLKLEPFQERELANVETQPPIQSLPALFQDFGNRIMPFIRGSK